MNPYRLLSTREIYRNPWVRLREDRIVRPDGKEHIFGVIEQKAGSSVLALNSRDEAYLVREYKYGIGRESLEVMSGGIEPGETPLDAARRELKEEAGLTARDWLDLGVVDPFTTAVNSPNYIFLARDVEQGEREPDEGEYIEIVKLPFQEVVAMAMRGEITHAASCVVILKVAAISAGWRA